MNMDDNGIIDGDTNAVYNAATGRVEWYANLCGHEVVILVGN